MYRLDKAKKSPNEYLRQHSKSVSVTRTVMEFHYWVLPNLGIMAQTSLSSYNNKLKGTLRWNVLSKPTMIILNGAMNHSLLTLRVEIRDAYMLSAQCGLSSRNGWAALAEMLLFTVLLHKNINHRAPGSFERSLHSTDRCTAKGRINYTSISPKTLSHSLPRELQQLKLQNLPTVRHYLCFRKYSPKNLSCCDLSLLLTMSPQTPT